MKARLPKGHLSAAQLFTEHASFLVRFVHRLGVRQENVDDVVQEVFLVAHRKGGYEPGPAKPRSWLCAIAVRVAASSRRATARRRRRELADSVGLDAAVAPGHDPARATEVQESLRRVADALETLDLDHRVPFVLYELEGESCDEIAATLGVPVGTVYRRLHTARRRFLAAYEDAPARAPRTEALLPHVEGA